MSQEQDLNDEVVSLQKKLAETRRHRMNVQKSISAKPLLEVALERASRNRSSGSTDETDELRDEINLLKDAFATEIGNVDRIRRFYVLINSTFQALPGRDRLIQRFNTEVRWRNQIIADGTLSQLGFPITKSVEVE